MDLNDIKGLGPKKIAKLNNEGIYNIKDLIFKFPKEYQIYEENIDLFYAGEMVLIKGIITSRPTLIRIKGKTFVTIIYLNYMNNKIKCCYYSNDFLKYKIKGKEHITFYGHYVKAKSEFIISKIFFEEVGFLIEPIYKFKGLTDKQISLLLQDIYKNNINISESLPDDIIKKYHLLGIKEFLYKNHFPSSRVDVKEVLRRRKYEEFFWYLMRLEALKDNRINDVKEKRQINTKLIKSFLNDIPFKLTSDQLNALSDIKKDVLGKNVMNRLLQGDVGSGKSIVALIFALMIISAGYQVAMMLPSELLANQQYNEAQKYFNKYHISVELLTSKIKQKDKADILDRLLQGRIDLIIGTHSLIEEGVLFKKLGGVIIDEQHRFGVEQRKKLISKFRGVDALYASATPIPRSLGLSYFGDLSISSIMKKPEGRKIIETKIISYDRLNTLFVKIKHEIKNHHQIYVVVPAIENDEKLMDLKKANDIFKNIIPEAKIGLLHGKLNPKTKNGIMDEFINGKVDILISTTVIEVGINVVNATTMIIMDAERFGLAELHQIRGRVGRGDNNSYCFLVTNDVKNARLHVIEESNDGFEISENDFKLRGPGDYLGDVQSGLAELNYSSFKEDFNIFNVAKDDAKKYFVLFKERKLQSKIFDEIYLDEKKHRGKLS